MSRGRIDPDEDDYYQAVLWISNQIPTGYQAWPKDVELIGARWRFGSLDALPDVADCATALVVLGDVNDDDLDRIPDILHGLEQHGPLIGAVIVVGVQTAAALHSTWCKQLKVFLESGNQREVAPPIISTVEIPEIFAVLRFFNQFTYAATLGCLDWVDVRYPEVSWQHACRYRQICAEDFDDAISSFEQVVGEATPIPLALLVGSDVLLEEWAELADIISEITPDKMDLLYVSLRVGRLSSAKVTNIQWLEYLGPFDPHCIARSASLGVES